MAHARRKANLAEALATKSLQVCTTKNSTTRSKTELFDNIGALRRHNKVFIAAMQF